MLTDTSSPPEPGREIKGEVSKDVRQGEAPAEPTILATSEASIASVTEV
jgi:hypothetical protein